MRSTKFTRHFYEIAIWALLLMIVFFFRVSTARASLGGGADSVEMDGVALSAKTGKSQSHPGYSVQKISSGASTIREYISPSGVVFGVAWNGKRHPDLSVLLGPDYFSDYRSALSSAKRVRGARHQSIQGENVVVETWGHMRNLQGHAYDPELLPEGVSGHDIR